MEITPKDFTEFGYIKGRRAIPRRYYDFIVYDNFWYKVTYDCEILCATNDKLQFCLEESSMILNGKQHSNSYTLKLVQETQDDKWVDISFYGLGEEDIYSADNISNYRVY